jgi:hypothetical protein
MAPPTLTPAALVAADGRQIKLRVFQSADRRVRWRLSLSLWAPTLPADDVRRLESHGYSIVEEFYDAAVSGADPIEARPGFAASLARIAGNGVRTIIILGPCSVAPARQRR